MSMPYTAMARISTNTQQFQSVPRRTYEVRGLKVQVPSNYVTREELNTTQALYTRNVVTAAVENTYQDWDGNFRTEKVCHL